MVAVRVSKEQRAAIVGAPGYFAAHPKPQSPRDLTGASLHQLSSRVVRCLSLGVRQGTEDRSQLRSAGRLPSMTWTSWCVSPSMESAWPLPSRSRWRHSSRRARSFECWKTGARRFLLVIFSIIPAAGSNRLRSRCSSRHYGFEYVRQNTEGRIHRPEAPSPRGSQATREKWGAGLSPRHVLTLIVEDAPERVSARASSDPARAARASSDGPGRILQRHQLRLAGVLDVHAVRGAAGTMKHESPRSPGFSARARTRMRADFPQARHHDQVAADGSWSRYRHPAESPALEAKTGSLSSRPKLPYTIQCP